ncbi:LOB domain-containing protein 24-like [Diospyros lotus]|uniref:LOB domain-containing protein 24-like n=1 Tax=Diospyros lotus TaxID=55363 RepID=UPI00225772DA|nr:LOB domain-containing protein 24-like [Diospyros lotus]
MTSSPFSPSSLPNRTCYASSSAPSTVTIVRPCAACKVLRRRCVEQCILAPYFPPNDPLKFAIAHRVFGSSNIIKILQEIPECHRADAVSSMVYEANARMRDPVYGCTGTICQLQKQVSELQVQLAKTQAVIASMRSHHQTDHPTPLACMDVSPSLQQWQQQVFYQDDGNLVSPAPASWGFCWSP